jgi:hypothetical protein
LPILGIFKKLPKFATILVTNSMPNPSSDSIKTDAEEEVTPVSVL